MIPKSQCSFIGDFNAPNFHWLSGFPVRLFLFKGKGDAICTSTYHLVSLSTHQLTAVLTQFQYFQSCHHIVCCSWCCQADCCHRLLTMILLCIYTTLRHMNSQYAPADCSLIFSFVSNYDRSCVYSNSTVGAAAHCFTDVILQDTDLAVLLVPLDSTNSLTGVLIH